MKSKAKIASNIHGDEKSVLDPSKKVPLWSSPEEIDGLVKCYASNVKVGFSACTLDGLQTLLQNNVNENGQYFIKLNINCISQKFEHGKNNHWAGLYIVKSFDKIIKIIYIDPMGRNIDTEISSEIKKTLNTTEISQPLLNKAIQCVKLNFSGSFIEQGNDKDCGFFLVYCIVFIINGKPIRQDINTIDESISFCNFLRESFSKRLSFNEIYKTISSTKYEHSNQASTIRSSAYNSTTQLQQDTSMSKQNQQHDPRQNAFNKKNDSRYQYQAADVKLIQDELMKDYRSQFTIYEPIGDNVNQQLQNLIGSINDNPVLCVYNLGNYHWVAFAALNINGKITILYKDSQGLSNSSLKGQIENKFGVDNVDFKVNASKEQILGVECGIFALQNIKIIAEQLSSTNKGQFIEKFEGYDEFCSLDAAQNLRQKDFADLFVLSTYSNILQESIKAEKLKKIRSAHQSEASELAENLKQAQGLKSFEVKALSADESIDRNQVKYTITVEIATSVIADDKVAPYCKISWTNDINPQEDLNALLKDMKIASDGNIIKIFPIDEEVINIDDIGLQTSPTVNLQTLCQNLCLTSQSSVKYVETILNSNSLVFIMDITSSLFFDQNEFIEKKIQNFEKAIKVALDYFDQERQLIAGKERQFIEALYRISWRSSEIPSKVRFGNGKYLENKAENANKMGERHWVLLDYLAESLNEYQTQDNQDESFFKCFYSELNYILEAIEGQHISSEKLQYLHGFVEKYYDKYLLQKIQTTLSKFEGISNCDEFIKDSKNCYAILRASEIISESFKNLSCTSINKIKNGANFQQALKKFRNALHHEKLRTELLLEYNPELLKQIITDIFPIIQEVITRDKAIAIPRDKFNEWIFSLNKITSILKQKQFINDQQIDEILSNIGKTKVKENEVKKYLYRLNDNALDERKYTELKAAFDESQHSLIWLSQYKIPYDQLQKLTSSIKKLPENIQQDIINWLTAPYTEGNDAGDNLIRNLPYKLLFQENKYEKIFRNLLKYKMMSNDKLLANVQSLSKDNEQILQLTYINNEELSNIPSALEFIEEKILQLSAHKETIHEQSISILYSNLLNNSPLVTKLIEELFGFIKYPEAILGKIIETGSLEVLHELYSNYNVEKETFIKVLEDSYLVLKEGSLEGLFQLWFNNLTNSLSQEFITELITHTEIDQNKLLEKLKNILHPEVGTEQGKQKDSTADSKIRALEEYILLADKPNENIDNKIEQYELNASAKEKIEKAKQEQKGNQSKKINNIIEKLEELKPKPSEIKKVISSMSFAKDELAEYITILKKDLEFSTKIDQVKQPLQNNAENIASKIADRQINPMVKNLILEQERQKFLETLENKLSNIVKLPDTKLKLVDKFKKNIKKKINFEDKFTEVLAKAFFDLDRSYEGNKADQERNKTLLNLKNNCSVYFKYFAQSKPADTSSSESASTNVPTEKKSPLLSSLKTLLNKLEEYVAHINSQDSHEMYTMSCEFIVERIGDISEKLARSKKFPETNYLSLSKYQLVILNVARKALAHHPLEIGDAKLRYFVEQLALEARHKVKETIFEGENVKDPLIEHKEITIEFLEENKNRIQDLVIQHGFREEFFIYSLDYGCDIGVQGDLNLVVITIDKNTKYSDLFSLEITLSKFFQAEIKVLNFEDLQTIQTRKIFRNHQNELNEIEEFTTFITTEKFRVIYHSEQWNSVKIGETEHLKNSRNITEDEFIKASYVYYIFSQKTFDKNKENVTKFRQDRIDKVEAIKEIIEEKAGKYLSNIVDGLDKLNTIFCNEVKFLHEFLLVDKYLDLSIDAYFHTHQEKIFRSDCNNILHFRWIVKGLTTNNGFKPILEENFQKVFNIWRECYEQLSQKLKSIVTRLSIFFYEIKNPKIFEKLLSQPINRDELKTLIFNDLQSLFCEDASIKVVSFIFNPLLFRLGNVSVQIERDIIKKVDFPSEVEYGYYLKYQQKLETILHNYPEIFNSNLHLDLEINDYMYKVPCISNGILGFSSELKRLSVLFAQISHNCYASKALSPDITIDSGQLYETIFSCNSLSLQGESHLTMRFNSKLKTLQDVSTFYGMTSERREQTSTQDKDNINDYYEYRELHDILKSYLLRLNKHYLEYKKLENLLNEEFNQHIRLLYGKRIEQIIQEAEFDLTQIKPTFDKVFKTDYVQERVRLVLQNPFKLQGMIDFVNTNYSGQEEKALNAILYLAKQHVEKAIIVEIFKNFEIDSKLSDYFVKKLDTNHIVQSIQEITIENLVIDELTETIVSKELLELKNKIKCEQAQKLAFAMGAHYRLGKNSRENNFNLFNQEQLVYKSKNLIWSQVQENISMDSNFQNSCVDPVFDELVDTGFFNSFADDFDENDMAVECTSLKLR